jgi:hypothetical protein
LPKLRVLGPRSTLAKTLSGHHTKRMMKTGLTVGSRTRRARRLARRHMRLRLRATRTTLRPVHPLGHARR